MTPQAYLYICDGNIDNPVLTHKKMDWPEKYPHWQEIPLVMAQPEQEPVAYGMWDTMLGKENRMMMVRLDKGQDGCNVPLYTTPPQPEPVIDKSAAVRIATSLGWEPKRTWQGLKDEERRGLREWQKIQEELGPVWAPMMLYLYDVIEAKLKEKNT